MVVERTPKLRDPKEKPTNRVERKSRPRDPRAKQFGQNLQAARVKAQLTQEKLAAKANLSVDHLRNIERGVRMPSAGIADDLRRAVGAKWEEIMPAPGSASETPEPKNRKQS